MDREIAAVTAELADPQARLMVQQLFAGSKRRPPLGDPLRIPRPTSSTETPEPSGPVSSHEVPQMASGDEMRAFFLGPS